MCVLTLLWVSEGVIVYLPCPCVLVCRLIYRHECFAVKYTTRKVHAKLHIWDQLVYYPYLAALESNFPKSFIIPHKFSEIF